MEAGGFFRKMRRHSFAAAAFLVFLLGFADVIYAEDAEKLYDSVIEWDEITDLVVYRNPTYVLVMNSANSSIQDLQNAVSDDILSLHESLGEADSAIEALKSLEKDFLMSGGSESDAAYRLLEQSLAATVTLRESVKESLSSMRSTSRSLRYSSASLERSLSSVRYELEAAIKSLIVTYKTLEINMDMLDAQISLYESLYNNSLHMENEGLGTASDAAGYRTKLEGARQSRSSLESAMRQIKGNILILTGYGVDEDVVIADLPAADAGYLDGRDIDADRNAAVSGNAAVIEAMSVSGYTGDVFKYRDMNLAAQEASAARAFNDIYAALAEQSLIGASSDTSLRRAELIGESAERKNELGLTGAAEYEALRLEYIAAIASVKLDELNLHQAIINYSYALKGVMSVD